jgi:chaperone modulatory protein CbpM
MNSRNEGPGDVVRAQMLDDDDWLRIDELCVRLHVEQHWIEELVELGALESRPADADPASWLLPRRELPRVRAMTRLVTDLGVNLVGAAIIVELVEERRRLLTRLGRG